LTQSRNAVSGVGMTVVVLLLISETPSRMNRAPRLRSTRPDQPRSADRNVGINPPLLQPRAQIP
jgi:hypothetical protein